MLSTSDTDIQAISELILSHGYDVAFLVPTQTGLEKSILDAHASLRSFLTRMNFHDYEQQAKGVIRKATSNFITNNETYKRTVSLYRPETKSGDPRIWIEKLNALAKVGNLLAKKIF